MCLASFRSDRVHSLSRWPFVDRCRGSPSRSEDPFEPVHTAVNCKPRFRDDFPGGLVVCRVMTCDLQGTVTLIEICRGAVGFGAIAMDQRWAVDISGGSVECGDLMPDREALSHFGSPFGRAEPVPSRSKVRGDPTEGRQEPLGMPRRFDALHRPPPSGGLRRILGPIVQILRPSVCHRRHQLPVRDPVTGQLIGHQHTRHIPQPLEQLTEEPLGRFAVSPGPHQHLQHVAVLIDRAPQVDEHLIKVPLVAGARAASTERVGVGRPNLSHQRGIVSQLSTTPRASSSSSTSRKLSLNPKYSHTQ
jgi:hypothetical protein